MTQEASGRPVIVGVDTSQASLRATCFAAEEAARRSVPLRIVHAVTWFDGMTSPPGDLDVLGLRNSGAESLVQGMADSVAGLLPADLVQTSVVEGNPVEVLRNASSGGSLLVLGGRGAGGVEGPLLGSTASGMVAQATCPVIVLPEDTAVRARGRSSVVVGVEGRGDEEVLAFAFGEAAARHTDLVAVHAWQDVVLETAFRSISPLADWAGVMADEERALAEALAGWSEKEPDVVVRELVVRERAARALVSAGLTAALLVVGHHRHRRLGSTTHAVLHRANCPVAVVPLPAGHHDDRPPPGGTRSGTTGTSLGTSAPASVDSVRRGWTRGAPGDGVPVRVTTEETRVPTTDEDRVFEVLDQAACRQLLDTTGTGRLGFTDGALPAILPVPFALQDGHVMIPAHRAGPTVSAVRGAVVAFEAGSYDAATRTGWSVTVVGPTLVLSRPAEVAALQSRFSSPPTPDRCYIAVVLGLLRGWRMSECPGVPGSAGPEAEARSPMW